MSGIKMIKPLYMTDSYLRNFSSIVVNTDGKNVMLGETAFYPQGGGQPCDLGTMEMGGQSFEVRSVFKKEGNIWHEIDREGLHNGQQVLCNINWDRRYRVMKMHTAAHIIDSVLFKEMGALTTGNQLGIDRSRIDFSLEVLDKEKILKYVEEANRIIQSGLEVKIYFLKREEALKIPGIVKLANAMPPEVAELRIVEIPGIDLQADGGTQVKNTREIGKIILISVENRGKNNRRIYFTLE